MRRLSSLLLYTGVGVCVLGVIGFAGGMWVNLSAEAVRRIAMALPFALGGVLLVVGALVGRVARHPTPPGRPERPPSDSGARQLGGGTPGWASRSSEPESTLHPAEHRDRAT